jgi:hypothetical protein
MPPVGDTILRAAQAVVGQIQNQQRLQQQQLQFEAQLRQADRTFSLRAQELQAREKTLKIQEEQLQLQQATAPFQQRIVAAQATLQESAASPEVQQARLERVRAETQKLLAESSGTTGGTQRPLTAGQALSAREKIVSDVKEFRQRAASEQYFNTLDPQKQGQVREYKALSLDELRSSLKTLDAAVSAGNIFGDALAAAETKRSELLNMIDFIRNFESTVAQDEDQLLLDAIKVRGIPEDDVLGVAATASLLQIRGVRPGILSVAFGDSVEHTTQGQLEARRAVQSNDVDWFVNRLRTEPLTPENQEERIRAMGTYFMEFMPQERAVSMTKDILSKVGILE